MAYYSGQASSYQEILNALVVACTANGWAWSNNILRKDSLYIQLDLVTWGIQATGGTGASGSSLLNPCQYKPRFGPPSSSVNLPTFPFDYKIFIFDSEVYLIGRTNIDTYYYLAFGKSTIALSSTGLWISATSVNTITSGNVVAINTTSGGSNSSSIYTSAAPFWTASEGTSQLNSIIAHGLESNIWNTQNSSSVSMISAMTNLIARLPNNWNSEAVLLPYLVFATRSSNKKTLVADFEHARVLRIDHLEPEQVITLGQDRWMVLPFHKKNISSKNGTSGGDHTGTFGWAIRYDGP